MEQSAAEALNALMRTEILSVTASDSPARLPTENFPLARMVDPPQKPSAGRLKLPYHGQFAGSQKYSKVPASEPLLCSPTDVREREAPLDTECPSLVPIPEVQPYAISRTEICSSPAATGPGRDPSALLGPPLPQLPPITSLLQSTTPPNSSGATQPLFESGMQDGGRDTSCLTHSASPSALQEESAGTSDCIISIRALEDKLQAAGKRSNRLTAHRNILPAKLSAAKHEQDRTQQRDPQFCQELERRNKETLRAKAEITTLKARLKRRDRENDRLHAIILTDAASVEERLRQARAEGAFAERSKARQEYVAQLAVWRNWQLSPGEAISNELMFSQGDIDTDSLLLLQRLSEKVDRETAVRLLTQESMRRMYGVRGLGLELRSIPAISSMDIRRVLECSEKDRVKETVPSTSRTMNDLDASTVFATDPAGTKTDASMLPATQSTSGLHTQNVPYQPSTVPSKRSCIDTSNGSPAKRPCLASTTEKEPTSDDTIIVDTGH